ncbi:MAG: hypothetical protein U0745_19305 [Polyangia bacterium]|jgi:hypothetical protein
MRHFLGLILLLGILSGCGDSTGGARVSFSAFAAGPASATGGPLTFTNHQGYAVTLTRAKLHIGAMYLNQTVPTSGAQETSCVLPGTYVAQVLSSVDVDALSPLLQPFADQGHGVATQAQVGELWLTGGDISAIDDQTVILDAAGTASLQGQSYPFEARLTIGRNRLIPTKDPAYPGSNPICKQRIVTPIFATITPAEGGQLILRVDPRGLFDGVDFSVLPKVSDAPLLYRFTDQNDNAADLSLFQYGLRARTQVYSFSWQ